jgi:hypothetical protein
MSGENGVAVAVIHIFRIVKPAPIIVMNDQVMDLARLEWRIDGNARQMADVFIVERVVVLQDAIALARFGSSGAT